MKSNPNNTEDTSGTSYDVGLCDRVRIWLDKNKVFFETVAAVLLSIMALILSTLHFSTTAKQTSLLKKQTNIADMQADLTRSQIEQQSKVVAITKAKDWATLRGMLGSILEEYPALGNFSEIPGIKNLSRKQKFEWLANMESMVSGLGTNPVLVASRHNYERYKSMLGALSLAKRMILSTDDPIAHKPFYSATVRVGIHARMMYLDLGMERTSYPTTDKRFQPSPSEESIFQKGFPWEKNLFKMQTLKGKDIPAVLDPKVNKAFKLNKNWYARAILYIAPHDFLKTDIKIRLIFTDGVNFVSNVSWGSEARDDPELFIREWFSRHENNFDPHQIKKSKTWEFTLPADAGKWRLFAFLSNTEIQKPSIEILKYE